MSHLDPSSLHSGAAEVSIVVPVWGTYGGEPLRGALESLRAQDAPARIIVVDNASDDPLARIEGAEVMRASRRVSVGSARNLGLNLVTTPYVMFWDADDLMLPRTLRFLHDEIAADGDRVAVAAAILEGAPPVPHRWPRRWTYPFARWRTLFALADCVWSLFPTTGSTIMRTAAVRDAGGYEDADSGEDWVLGVSLAFRGRVVLSPRPGRIYRRHGASLWESRRSLPHLVRHARAVRRRIRDDPGIPSWTAPLLPGITLLQLLAVLAIQPGAKLARRAGRVAGAVKKRRTPKT